MTSINRVTRLAPLRAAAPAPRLRFDKVVLRLMADVQAAVRDVIPDGITVLVTVTAPIHVPGKTASAIAAAVRRLLERPSPRTVSTTVHGNGVCLRLVTHTLARAPKVMGVVHNPEPNPRRLLAAAAAWLAVLGRASEGRGAGGDGPWTLEVQGRGRDAFAAFDHHVCAQLLPATPFTRILLVDNEGREHGLAG